MLTSKQTLIAGLIFCFLSVVFGAFGAHGLRAHLTEDMRAVWQTAVMYQFFHALALIGLSLWMKQEGIEALRIPLFFLAGILLFSGSLYLLALTGVTWLGAITPIGGTLFLSGWLMWIFKVGSSPAENIS